MTTPQINFFQVPESAIIDMADELDKELKEFPDDNEKNNFRVVLNKASVYKEAGLNPIYIINSTFDQLQVIPEEYLKKEIRFH